MLSTALQGIKLDFSQIGALADACLTTIGDLVTNIDQKLGEADAFFHEHISAHFPEIQSLVSFPSKAEAKRILVRFLENLVEKVETAFTANKDLLSAFRIFDPYQWPEKSADLDPFGNTELETLLQFYSALFSEQEIVDLRMEWPTFKRAFQAEALMAINEKDKTANGDISQLETAQRTLPKQQNLCTFGFEEEEETEEEEMDLTSSEKAERNKVVFAYEISSKMLKSSSFRAAFKNCLSLLEIYLCLPVSVAHVEGMHSKMKLIKSRLRSRLTQINLDYLMRVTSEGPTESEFGNAHVLKCFAEWLKKPRKLETLPLCEIQKIL